MRFTKVFSVIAFLVLSHAVSVNAFDPLVVGDRKLLSQVVRSLEAGRVSFPKGEIEYTFKELRRGSESTSAKVRTLWSGDKQFWEYSYEFRDFSLTEPLPNGETELVESHEKVRRLVTNSKVSTFFPTSGSSGYLNISSEKRRDPAYLQARPSDRWYRKEYGRRFWDEYLNPESLSDYVTKIVVAREGDDVTILRVGKDKSAMELVFSIRQGLNLIRYRTVPAPDGTASSDGEVHTGEYEWQDAGENRWVIKKIAFQEASASSPSVPFLEVEINVLDFKERRSFSKEQFTDRILGVTDSALVHKTSSRGLRESYRYGNPDGVDLLPDSVLNKLSEELRQLNFARPK